MASSTAREQGPARALLDAVRRGRSSACGGQTRQSATWQQPFSRARRSMRGKEDRVARGVEHNELVRAVERLAPGHDQWPACERLLDGVEV
jgi:hypothetical protein